MRTLGARSLTSRALGDIRWPEWRRTVRIPVHGRTMARLHIVSWTILANLHAAYTLAERLAGSTLRGSREKLNPFVQPH